MKSLQTRMAALERQRQQAAPTCILLDTPTESLLSADQETALIAERLGRQPTANDNVMLIYWRIIDPDHSKLRGSGRQRSEGQHRCDPEDWTGSR